jgi:hypothetical protein
MPNVNIKAHGQPMKPSQPASSSAAQAPSVPISLYREVASELQTTRSTLQSLKTENQELTQKNQQLRLEIERVVQSALHLRQIADPSWGSVSSDAMAIAMPAELAAPTQMTGLPTASPSEPLFTEQAEPAIQPSATEAAAEISTWWLILIIGMIVVTAFGTGFLIVRPLLPSR